MPNKIRSTSGAFLLGFALLCSCGPSTDEQRKMEMKATAELDSIKQAARNELQQEQERAKAIADSTAAVQEMNAQDLLQLQAAIAELENERIMNTAELAAANDRLVQAGQFQFGRTSTERQDQIKRATIEVEGLKDRIASINRELGQLRVQESELIDQAANWN